jgi:phosphate transport system substrate-binding protein
VRPTTWKELSPTDRAPEPRGEPRRIIDVNLTHPRRLGALALVAAFALGACSGSGSSAAPTTAATDGATTAPAESTAPESAAPADLTGTVNIDGSSTVYPITQAVAEDFQGANPGVQVPVAFSGTGGGFKKFCVGETDLNDASRPIKADDEGEGVACTTNGVDFVELQIAIDGLTVVVNPENTWATCMTVAQLATIYGPDSKEGITWADVDPSWPAEPIDAYMPGADSGTFDYFTEEINGEVDVAAQWPTQSEDDNILVTGVAGNKNAIGFFGYAYFVENQDKLKAVEIDGGAGCVAPTEATINDNTYTPLSRPLFIYPDTGKAKTNPALKAFVDYYLANGSTLAAEVGYVAVPADILAAETAEWAAAVGQ